MHDTNKTGITLIFLVVAASGCINSTGGEGIVVHGLEVQPSQIVEDSEVRARVELSNQGELPAKLQIGEDGRNILNDYCRDQFNIKEEDFNVVSTGEEANINDKDQVEVLELETGQDAIIEWILEHDGEVPFFGYGCDMRFGLPFEYSVQGFQEIEVKKDRTVEASSIIDSQSSRGPLFFGIETQGSTAEEGEPVFVADDDNIEILLQVQHVGGQEDRYTSVELHEETLEIKSEGLGIENFKEDCNINEERNFRLLEGETEVIVCPIGNVDSSELENPAEIFEIQASIEYEYLKNLGTRAVQVDSRG